MNETEKWFWKFDYCKKNLLDPGDKNNWDEAEKALEEELNK